MLIATFLSCQNQISSDTIIEKCLNHLALPAMLIASGSLLELLLLSLSMLCLAASTKGTHSRGGGLVTCNHLLLLVRVIHFLVVVCLLFNIINVI